MKIEELRSILQGLPEASAPAAMFPKVIELYVLERIDHTEVEADGDMLLFQWGTNDWGKGPFFELDLTRQVMVESSSDADPDILQLSCRYAYLPNPGLQSLGSGNQWCVDPDSALEFWDSVMGHPALSVVSDLEPLSLSLTVIPVGS